MLKENSKESLVESTVEVEANDGNLATQMPSTSQIEIESCETEQEITPEKSSEVQSSSADDNTEHMIEKPDQDPNDTEIILPPTSGTFSWPSVEVIMSAVPSEGLFDISSATQLTHSLPTSPLCSTCISFNEQDLNLSQANDEELASFVPGKRYSEPGDAMTSRRSRSPSSSRRKMTPAKKKSPARSKSAEKAKKTTRRHKKSARAKKSASVNEKEPGKGILKNKEKPRARTSSPSPRRHVTVSFSSDDEEPPAKIKKHDQK